MDQDAINIGSVFDAAKAIVETLKGLDQSQQQLAIRFATESLHLTDYAQNQQSLKSGSASTISTPPQLTAPAHPTDIRQFVATKNPKSHQQFAAVVAYFYRYHVPEDQKKETITPTDLRESVRLARWSGLTNPGMTLNNAKTAGYLDNAGRGKFRISTVGENLVAITLPGSADDGAGIKNNGIRRPRKANHGRRTAVTKKRSKAVS